jgi:hypothetical protein
MRHFVLMLCSAAALVGCNDDTEAPRVSPEAGANPAPLDRDNDASVASDARAPEASANPRLLRPSLPRPPTQGLPQELWPPTR